MNFMYSSMHLYRVTSIHHLFIFFLFSLHSHTKWVIMLCLPISAPFSSFVAQICRIVWNVIKLSLYFISLCFVLAECANKNGGYVLCSTKLTIFSKNVQNKSCGWCALSSNWTQKQINLAILLVEQTEKPIGNN